VRATAFFENTENALYSQTNFSVTPNITNIQNVDKIRTKGIELALQANGVFVPNLDATASFTFADSRTIKNDKNPSSVGKWQPRVPRARANLALTYRATEQLSTTLGWRYSGTQYGALDNSDINANSYLGFSKFSVVDVRTQYKANKNWTVSLGVDNLNNQKYWAFHPYPQRTYTGDVKWSF
jgi:iron complex outermembrane recepter protein